MQFSFTDCLLQPLPAFSKGSANNRIFVNVNKKGPKRQLRAVVRRAAKDR